MTKNILFILCLSTFGLLFENCSTFNTNEFISTENIGQIGDETFIYSAYKTGIDNYRIDFKVIVDSDTSMIFEYNINDALYTKERSFHFTVLTESLVIMTPFQSCKTFYKTSRGTTVELTNTADTKPCKD